MAYRILSLDGGGIRGLITIIFMERLLERHPNWLEGVDLFAGTSTGGILSLGLASGLTPAELKQMYLKHGAEIFADSLWDDVKDLGRLAGAEYSSDNLKRITQEIFGDRTLGDLKQRVVVPVFDLDNEAQDARSRSWKPKIFHNFPGPDVDADMPLWKVAFYTSLAPTYFPPSDGYIDGGVFANSPGMIALGQTQDQRSAEPNPALDEVRLLSLGTGRSLSFIDKPNPDWGEWKWVRPLLQLMFQADMDVADYQCRQFLGDRYHRLNLNFPPGTKIPMDDVVSVVEMETYAKTHDLEAAFDWLERHWL